MLGSLHPSPAPNIALLREACGLYKKIMFTVSMRLFSANYLFDWFGFDQTSEAFSNST